MRYQVKQKLVSVGDDFKILNENGQDAFFVDGYGFSFGNKLSFQSMAKQELLMIRQSLFTFLPCYKFSANKKVIATVKKQLIAFRPTFILNILSAHRQIKIVGKLMENEYLFLDGSQTIATVSKKWFRAADTYAVDIKTAGMDEILLAAAIVVDLICHDKESKHKRRGRSTS